ncbi:MAG: hypothetical protein EU530_07760 [Promethearchaeota archaeon]|nr:MAG: hypothetical protein EU530_07760 [Candidatus Lokiarchaeota archaeon]
MPNYTRGELANNTATMNQMRNNLYHFLRYLMSKGVTNQQILVRLQRMGSNIAKTILEEREFTGATFEDKIVSIYSEMFNSKISITENSSQFVIEDKKCSLCKYKRENLSVAPCEVITSFVEEILIRLGYTVNKSHVSKSIALGDISCIHTYDLKERDN